MLSQYKSKKRKMQMIILGLAILMIAALPAFAIGGKRNDLYVDDDAKGTHDGSSRHPYKTIGAAIDKAKGRTDIHVAKGKYEENITLKDGVRLYGEDKEKTIIKADKDKWSVIYFEEDAEINGFTIKDGKRGIWIDKYAKASIVDCIIEDNEKDGIGIEGGKDTKKENAVYISDTQIKDNGKAGIYMNGKRRVVIVDNEIYRNGSDGIDLPRGTSAWIADSKIKDNRGSGLKMVLDASNIWSKDMSIRDNKREGVEVSFYGSEGRINFEKTKIVNNQNYAIARLQRASFSTALWDKYLTFGKNMAYWGNAKGNISRSLFIR